jgi:hypothetical protein
MRIEIDEELLDLLKTKNKPFTKMEAWVDLCNRCNEAKTYTFKSKNVNCEFSETAFSFGELSLAWRWSKTEVSRFISVLEEKNKIQVQTEAFATKIKVFGLEKVEEKPIIEAFGENPVGNSVEETKTKLPKKQHQQAPLNQNQEQVAVMEIAPTFEAKITMTPTMTSTMKPNKKNTKAKSYFSETLYYEDYVLFQQEFLARFPTYDLYNLESYHKSAQNWGQGETAEKYKKIDWILTVKTWIDGDEQKGKSVKANQSKIQNLGELVSQGHESRNYALDILLKKQMLA